MNQNRSYGILYYYGEVGAATTTMRPTWPGATQRGAHARSGQIADAPPLVETLFCKMDQNRSDMILNCKNGPKSLLWDFVQ
jgi:hypothetical protein